MEREVEYQLLLFVDNFPIIGENKAAACAVLGFFLLQCVKPVFLKASRRFKWADLFHSYR